MWNVLGQAATVAQLVGADVGGLISMIIQAAAAAQQNKKECEQLARRIFNIGELLQHLQDPEVLRRPELRRPLAGLGDTLREAHELVMACQDKSAVYRLVLAWRQADKFRDVESRIDSYLLLFPVISHIDITRHLDRIYNILLPANDTAGPSALAVSMPQIAVQDSQSGVRGILSGVRALYNGAMRGILNLTTDVYSFGVVILEVLTGRRAYFSGGEWEEKKREACEKREVLEEEEKEDRNECEEEDMTEEWDEETEERVELDGFGRYSLVNFVVPLIEADELWKVVDRRPAATPTPRQLKAAELVALWHGSALRAAAVGGPAIHFGSRSHPRDGA